MKVRDVMSRDVQVASPTQSIRDAAKMMAKIDAGVLPVGENDRLVGMITDRDIAIRAVAEGKAQGATPPGRQSGKAAGGDNLPRRSRSQRGRRHHGSNGFTHLRTRRRAFANGALKSGGNPGRRSYFRFGRAVGLAATLPGFAVTEERGSMFAVSGRSVPWQALRWLSYGSA